MKGIYILYVCACVQLNTIKYVFVYRMNECKLNGNYGSSAQTPNTKKQNKTKDNTINAQMY